MTERCYLAIDLKSFYASVECVERGLDPFDSNLVVADPTRGTGTICLAVSPALKALGVSSRPRVFEVNQTLEQLNRKREHLCQSLGRPFVGSTRYHELIKDPALKIEYLKAPPQMRKYLNVSAEIYGIYRSFFEQQDLSVYSIDEVFIDLTHYVKPNLTAREIASQVVERIYKTTGITATAGIGTNLYLCKIAMDIVAKHQEPNEFGLRIASLTEQSFKEQMWTHTPITDFWRTSAGTARRLATLGLYTMGDIAEYSCDRLQVEKLYKLFGIGAEHVIDHAWGVDLTTMQDIKALRPRRKSLSQGQVLMRPYNYEDAKTVVWEMAEQLSLQLVEYGYMAKQVSLDLIYEGNELKHNEQLKAEYQGPLVLDHYGRIAPKPAHGVLTLEQHTSATSLITEGVMRIFTHKADARFSIRQIRVCALELLWESEVACLKEQHRQEPVQLDLFGDYERAQQQEQQKEQRLAKEHRLQQAMLKIKSRHGKNAIMRAVDLLPNATTPLRNRQIGGHKA
ncbi:MAG: hypothetical protein K6F05_03775 [Succinivibrio sp.]|nr:hypothetical protein [Succinivibrio sp.]